MPITFACPQCQATLRMADQYAGQQARCPGCGGVARVPGFAPAPQPAAAPPKSSAPAKPAVRKSVPAPPPQPAPESAAWEVVSQASATPPQAARRPDWDMARAEESAPRPAAAGGWRTARTGLGLVLWGTILVLLTVFAAVGLGAAVMTQRLGPREGGLCGLGAGGLLLLGCLLSLAGLGLCCAAPAARWASVGAALCTFFSLFGSLAGGVGSLLELPPAVLASGGAASALLSGLAGLLFLLFLRGVAVSFGRRGLARQVIYFIVLSIVGPFLLAGISVGAVLVFRAAGDRGGETALVFYLVVGAVNLTAGVLYLLWYLGLVAGARAAIVPPRTSG